MNLFTLYADLALDASGFERGVTKASKQGNALASSLRGGLGNASQVVINNMSAASVAVGNLLADVARATVSTGKQLVQTGVEYNSQMETYQVNFATMLGGSKSAAESLTDELKEMAAVTPFGMTDLADATQTLLSFGQDSSTVLDTLQSLGDIAMGDKNKLASLTLAFSQASSAGKLMGQDLMQMINAGFNPLTTIAEKTGASIGDLKDFMSTGKASKELQKQFRAARLEVKKMGDGASDSAKMLAQMYKDGAISAELLGQIFDIETSPGGRFYNAMENASKTISGLSATLEDDFTALTGKVLTPVTDWLRDKLLPSAIDAVGRLDAAFDVGGLKGLASEAIAIVKETFAEWGTVAFDAGSGLLANVLSGLTGDTVNKDEVQKTLSGIWDAGTTGLDNIWTAATTFWSDLNTKLGEDTTVGDKIASVFGAFNTAKSDLLTAAGTLFTDIYGKLSGDTANATNIQNSLSGLFKGWSEAKNSMLTAAGTLFDTVYEKFTGQEATAENVRNTVAGIFTAGVDAAGDLLETASAFFTDLAMRLGEDTTAGKKIEGVFTAGSDAMGALVTDAGTLFSRMYEALTNDSESAEKIEKFFSDFGDGVSTVGTGLNGIVGGMVDGYVVLFGELQQKWDEFKANNPEMFRTEEKWRTGGTNSTKTASPEAQQGMKDAFAVGALGSALKGGLPGAAALGIMWGLSPETDLRYYTPPEGESYEELMRTRERMSGKAGVGGEGDSSEIVSALNANTAAVGSIPGAVAAALSGAKVEMDGTEVGQLVLETVSLGIIRGGRLERKTGYEGGTQ